MKKSHYKFTKKEKIEGNDLKSLQNELKKVLIDFIPHLFRMKNQFRMIREMKTDLSENACAVQVDFSENWETKIPFQIQSMHYGASKRQISLHTVHVMTTSGPRCFCTVADDPRHTAPAIWAHLEPVLVELKRMGMKEIKFISDGPLSQYKNRYNFYLMSKIPFQLGFEQVSWDFLETSHGKGRLTG